MSSPLLFRPNHPEEFVITRVTAKDAGWDLLNMEVRQYPKGQLWQHHTGEYESVIVVLGGQCTVKSSVGSWETIGRREHVFDGMPYALYLPTNTEFTLTALTGNLEFAYCWVKPDKKEFNSHLVTPEESKIEIRGGHHATRQINSIIPPGFNCDKIVSCEVYTPHGNWSSYPPHKHSEHKEAPDGTLIEADLEEFYFYKIKSQESNPNKTGGYAIQRVYTDERDLDETITAHDNDIVLVPRGYHPVSAASGFDCYYLNFLAGSAQSLACSDDPEYTWVKGTWENNQDSRVPMVTHAMERQAQPVLV